MINDAHELEQSYDIHPKESDPLSKLPLINNSFRLESLTEISSRYQVHLSFVTTENTIVETEAEAVKLYDIAIQLVYDGESAMLADNTPLELGGHNVAKKIYF